MTVNHGVPGSSPGWGASEKAAYAAFFYGVMLSWSRKLSGLARVLPIAIGKGASEKAA